MAKPSLAAAQKPENASEIQEPSEIYRVDIWRLVGLTSRSLQSHRGTKRWKCWLLWRFWQERRTESLRTAISDIAEGWEVQFFNDNWDDRSRGTRKTEQWKRVNKATAKLWVENAYIYICISATFTFWYYVVEHDHWVLCLVALGPCKYMLEINLCNESQESRNKLTVNQQKNLIALL